MTTTEANETTCDVSRCHKLSISAADIDTLRAARFAGNASNVGQNAAVTVTISLVTNRKHAAWMALQKRFSKVRKQFVDC